MLRANLRGSGRHASWTEAFDTYAIVAHCNSALGATATGRAFYLSNGTHERYVLTAAIKRKKRAGALVADSLSAERVGGCRKGSQAARQPGRKHRKGASDCFRQKHASGLQHNCPECTVTRLRALEIANFSPGMRLTGLVADAAPDI